MSRPDTPAAQPDNEIEPIDPDEARQAIQEAIQQQMPDWKENGWLKIYESNFLVRFHKDKTNLDFQCDLLGNVEMIERDANPIQLGGRLVAWMVLLASLAAALFLALLSGVIG